MVCPTCRQPISWTGNPWRPFCSERCQVTDLGTWAAGQYRIPGPPLTLAAPLEEGQEDEKAEQVKRNP